MCSRTNHEIGFLHNFYLRYKLSIHIIYAYVVNIMKFHASQTPNFERFWGI